MITPMSLVEVVYEPTGERRTMLMGRIPCKDEFIHTLTATADDNPLVVENVLLMEIDIDAILDAPLPVAVIQARPRVCVETPGSTMEAQSQEAP